jgi:hypothetical protein
MYAAANYMLGEWKGLENIFTCGIYKLDTNTIERLNRYISLSRRNSLFFGSHKGARKRRYLLLAGLFVQALRNQLLRIP